MESFCYFPKFKAEWVVVSRSKFSLFDLILSGILFEIELRYSFLLMLQSNSLNVITKGPR